MCIDLVMYYYRAVELNTVFSRCTLILYFITTMYINLVLYYYSAVELSTLFLRLCTLTELCIAIALIPI